MMPPGAYIEGYRRISPILHRPLPGRTLSSQVLANGEGRGADTYSWRIVVLCAETSTEPRLCARTLQYMLCMASSVRRGLSPATPLRTGSISKAAVSNGLRYRFFALLGMTVCFAQNDSDLSAELFCSGRVFPPFPVSVPRRLPAL